ncbi:hypothetical protein LOTGIDRAFT_159803 [Lottia gigantea]|uniref:Ionotropic glutamate receptor L-glutamate and glycine-binding domain-containing protein n=1 Tax=Lottia gigantea TaxID=225164 RepID=V4C4D7_LOTGI|nr:hypothetical protein LOTGIDRAFT_159803 [Lottia gigantea]ESO96399.1 hypothetical protein LOTGIDRAFT_159803 [Lottia gigantea]
MQDCMKHQCEFFEVQWFNDLSLPDELMTIEKEYRPDTDLSTIFSQMDTSRNLLEFNVLLICSEDCINEVLNQGNEYEKATDSFTSFKHRSRWLIFTYQWIHDRQLHVHLDHVTVIDLNQSLTEPFCIHSLMWREGRRREFSCRWLERHIINPEALFPNVNQGLNGRVFRVVTKIWPPYTIRKNETVFDGLCIELLEIISQTLNFSYTIRLSPDGQWGLNDRGNWTGLIGCLVRKEADLMVAAIGISKEREDVMDFTFPYLFNHGVAMFKLRNNPEDEKWQTLLKPFTLGVLACIGAALITAGVIYHLIEKFNPYYTKPPTLTFWYRIEYLYGALLAHGCGNLPEDLAGRMFVGCWWVFCIVLAASYSGTLIATLAVNIEQYPFETLDEMLEQNNYRWGCMGNTLFIPLFSNTSNTRFKAIWDGIVQFNLTNPAVLSETIGEQFNLVQNEEYVFLGDESIYEDLSRKDCQIKVLKERYFSIDFAFGLQNNSPYTGQFSQVSLMILESHLVETLRRKWWRREACAAFHQAESKTIDLASLQSVFYFLLVGLFLAAITLLVEFLSHSNYNKFLLKFVKKRNE